MGLSDEQLLESSDEKLRVWQLEVKRRREKFAIEKAEQLRQRHEREEMKKVRQAQAQDRIKMCLSEWFYDERGNPSRVLYRER